MIILASGNALSQTPAADVSTGAFGANTGGGNYSFPALLGIGTTTPGARLHVKDTYGEIRMQDNDSTGAAARSFFTMYDSAGNFMGYFGDGFSSTTIGAYAHSGYAYSVYTNGLNERLRIDTAGNHNFNAGQLYLQQSTGRLGIGTTSPTMKLHVVGDGFVSGTLSGGNIVATYQDIAEWVPSAAGDLEPGTVVVLDTESVNRVQPSSSAYDTRVAGVVSLQPGITLGVPSATSEKVATTGRVKVRVDATHGAVRVGDLLVTGIKPGTAMRSEAMDINGRKFHQPGTILGKALEPLPSGEGMILVLLSLQ